MTRPYTRRQPGPFTSTLTALRHPDRRTTTHAGHGRRPTRAVQAERAATVAAMTAAGVDRRTIARQLGISIRTLRRYRARLRETT